MKATTTKSKDKVETRAPRLTSTEWDALADKAKADLAKAQTKADVIAVWQRYYLQIGHKALARLLLGRDARKKAVPE